LSLSFYRSDVGEEDDDPERPESDPVLALAKDIVDQFVLTGVRSLDLFLNF
jgi:hypothetical protein